MLCNGRASFLFNLLKVPAASLRPSFSSTSSPSRVSTTTVSLRPRRALSTMTDSRDDLFNYTSGRWVYNDALRHKERRLPFNVDGLCRLAAASINQSPNDILSFSKLAEGGFNRTFLLTLRNHSQTSMIARIPYPITVPKYYAVASEVATIQYLRSSGVPAPEIYGYAGDAENEAGTPYILMEFVQGYKLSEVWPRLDDQEVISVIRQLAELEARMMALPFPAGGSLYFTEDLEKVAPGRGVPLDDPDERFCVGPDVRMPLWYGRREKLDVNRGPYQSAEAALRAAAHKELAYLKQFGRPILPFRRERRPSYKYQQQLPSHHVENLERYLDITEVLVPKDPSLSRWGIRHPDLQLNNIMVSRSADSDLDLDSECKIVSLIDWQHTSILPMFLLAGVPQRLQNYDDDNGISQSTTLPVPSPPENLEGLNPAGAKRSRSSSEEYAYRRRLAHYHYVNSTAECNEPHHAALTDPLYALRGRLFQQASAPWEGETFELKAALIQATQNWAALTARGGVGITQCPITFNTTDLHDTSALADQLSVADRGFGFLQAMCGAGEEGFIPSEDYEHAVAFLKVQCKDGALAEAESAEEWEEIMGHWPWDDMDEEEYM